jgi:hypothetical protein
VRLLLDENLPHDLGRRLSGHEVSTVVGEGWAGVQNGALLKLASGKFDALLTMDRRLPTQQRIADLPFAVILLHAVSNRLVHLEPLVPELLRTLRGASPGALHIVGA